VGGPAWLAAYESDQDDRDDADDEAAAGGSAAASGGQFDDTAAALRALSRVAGVAPEQLPPPDRVELADARKAALIRHGRRLFKARMRRLAVEAGLATMNSVEPGGGGGAGGGGAPQPPLDATAGESLGEARARRLAAIDRRSALAQ